MEKIEFELYFIPTPDICASLKSAPEVFQVRTHRFGLIIRRSFTHPIQSHTMRPVPMLPSVDRVLQIRVGRFDSGSRLQVLRQ